MQKAIGSDIMMVLDQCIPSTAPLAQAEAAMEITHRWALVRSLEARGDSLQALLGIVQGAVIRSCALSARQLFAAWLPSTDWPHRRTRRRRESRRSLASSRPGDGLPAGGICRYLMGGNSRRSIISEAVIAGHTFDCIIPCSTAASRHGVHVFHRTHPFDAPVHRLSEAR